MFINDWHLPLIIFHLSGQTRLCLIYSVIHYPLSINPKLVQTNRISKHKTSWRIFREEAIYQPWLVFMDSLSWSNWNLEMSAFVEGGKLENPEKNPRSMARANNKLYARLESNLGHIGRKRVFSPSLHHYCSPHTLFHRNAKETIFFN